MNKKGFTYVEMLAVLAILVLVVTLVNDNFVSGLKTWVTGTKLTEIKQFLRYDMQTLCNNIRFAVEVNYQENGVTNAVIDEVKLTNSPNTYIEVILASGYTARYSITSSNELLLNNNSLAEPFTEITIRRVNIFSYGSLYEITMKTSKLNYENIPSLNLKQLVFAPNIKS
ncbi:prepilin-type N-terminal cleavage/methylation domain-containing protein [Clostridium sp. 'deep sea']|uniref:type II secretion system protein n=1 Tax=Clostridium sp. 'deep sea' TaxID=2779445 RepID=UPI001896735F|nr:prepilin-type N-terminal cleavage/methylation domain-containing protein [Clostridium sp. 'deep sea']QOR35913.1 prepilin-type N-terminal cleavage/methylation domain-containing protein [Clostridium sp. 'deep sea']